MNKNVILISSSANDISDKRISDKRRGVSLGIGYLASSLINAGFNCDIVDADLYNDVSEVVKKALLYDIVGISSNSITFKNAVLIAEKIKEIKNLPIILGGYHATFKDKQILRDYNCFDIIVRGEGENVLVDLCNDYMKHNDFVKLYDGVSYKNYIGKTVMSEKIIFIDDINKIPFPLRSNMLNYPKVVINNVEMVRVPVLTSRGCPFKCSFCSVNRFRSRVLYRDIVKIVDEVELLYKEYGQIYFSIIDDNFYLNIKRCKDIINSIQERCKSDLFFSFTARADALIKYGEKELSFFKNKGCQYIEIGIENGSDEVLKRYNKKTTVYQNKEALKLMRKAKIDYVVDYILYDPWININELKENIDFMKSTNLFGHYPPILYNRIKPLPGNSYDGIGITNENYFINKDVHKIAFQMEMFNKEYQTNINLIIDNIKIRFRTNEFTKNKENTQIYIWLKILPYKLFEYLVYYEGDYSIAYNDFIKENQVDKKVTHYMETLFL
jgi:radical SAM superfamily enzyme YgiQ (UPF0313 family)